jgi:signal recognition particle subunit SRP54
MSLVPGGIGKLVKEVNIEEDTFKPFEAMIYAMTPQERAQPHLLDRSRRARIAKGSGMSLPHVNKLLKQFENMSKMMRTLSQVGNKPMLGNIKKV